MRLQRAVSLISTPVPTSSGPTVCRITSGDGGMRNLYALHAALWCGLCMVAGCAGPSVRDFQMMQASLKAESAQAQRTITDLRAEMQGVQRDLGAARAARAKQKPTSARLAVPMYKDVSDQPALSGESAESASRTVIVERGDTLWGLARKHRVRLSELIAVNDLTSDLIRPGQELILPEP